MKKLILLALLALPFPAHGSELKIERSYVEHDYLNVLVTYKNTSGKTLRAVTVKCKALDSAGGVIALNKRSFFDHDVGPIKNGFSESLEIPIGLRGASPENVTCNLYEQ